MNIRQFLIRSAWVALIFAGSLTVVAADKPDASGTWKWTVQGRNGAEPREVTLNLKQDGEKLSGALQGQNRETPITDGKVQGSEVSFKVTRETQRGTTVSTYAGKIDGDNLKGTITVKNGERTNEREWNARRQSSGLTGDWAWVLKRDDGEPWTATLKIKQEGEKLTGFFQRQDSDLKIELRNGKISGDKISFETVMERDGQSTTISSSAVVSGKTMKGKSEGSRDGEKWSREWEATRK